METDNRDHATRPTDDAHLDQDEQEFLRAHRRVSFLSSFSFAMAGATFLGVLTTLSNTLVKSFEEGESRPFKNPKTPILMGAMAAIGTGFMYLSNWMESKKEVLEWRLGGKKLRKAHLADVKDQAEEAEVAAQPPEAERTHVPVHEEAQLDPLAASAKNAKDITADPHAPERADGKSWADASHPPEDRPPQL